MTEEQRLDLSYGKGIIKIWVDDIREKPEDYDFWLKSTEETIRTITEEFCWHPNQEIILSLDHDCGDYKEYGGDYIRVLDYLDEQYNYHPYSKFSRFIKEKVTFHLHTANPVGRDNMKRIIQKNGWREV